MEQLCRFQAQGTTFTVTFCPGGFPSPPRHPHLRSDTPTSPRPDTPTSVPTPPPPPRPPPSHTALLPICKLGITNPFLQFPISSVSRFRSENPNYRKVHHNHRETALRRRSFCPRGGDLPLFFFGERGGGGAYLLRVAGEVGDGEGGQDHEERVVVEQPVLPQLLRAPDSRPLQPLPRAPENLPPAPPARTAPPHPRPPGMRQHPRVGQLGRGGFI